MEGSWQGGLGRGMNKLWETGYREGDGEREREREESR